MNYPNLLERFLTYVKVNTRSDNLCTTIQVPQKSR